MAAIAPRAAADRGSARPGADRPARMQGEEEKKPTARPADAREADDGRRPPEVVPLSTPGLLLATPAWDETAPRLGVATGADFFAPRDLTLWRIDREGGRAAPLAHGRSAADGRFAFERLPLPERGAELVVTPRGGSPFAAHPRLASQTLPPRPPDPPRAWLETTPEGDAWLRVEPRATGGALLVADARGRELARVALTDAPPAAREPVWIALGPLAEQGTLPRVAHALPDGRLSAWRTPRPVSVLDASLFAAGPGPVRSIPDAREDSP